MAPQVQENELLEWHERHYRRASGAGGFKKSVKIGFSTKYEPRCLAVQLLTPTFHSDCSGLRAIYESFMPPLGTKSYSFRTRGCAVSAQEGRGKC
jgi:hypothetical protein